jgi:GT2 family glycosyltransferase
MAIGAARCTIVIPTFDTAALLERCLQALLADLGDRRDVEVVVSDDGSADATGAVLARLRGAVRVVRSPVNRGFAAACNAGAAAASGDLLVFCNTDLVPHRG